MNYAQKCLNESCFNAFFATSLDSLIWWLVKGASEHEKYVHTSIDFEERLVVDLVIARFDSSLLKAFFSARNSEKVGEDVEAPALLLAISWFHEAARRRNREKR